MDSTSTIAKKPAISTKLVVAELTASEIPESYYSFKPTFKVK